MNVALLGATGAVGRTMLEVLAERELPVERLLLLASPRSEGSTIRWRGEAHTVRVPEAGCFRGIDLALFSAGAERSREWGPRAAAEGAVVVDNSSAWRMDDRVPLVVPEVNAAAMRERPRGIIANPNCSTIQVVVALKPLLDAAGLERVVMTTFQSVSGAGEKGRSALRDEQQAAAEDGCAAPGPFTRRILGNVVPQIGEFDDQGWTGEERKMIHEPRKILGAPELSLAATCVRVPVEVGHAVQVMVRTERELDVADAAAAMRGFAGLELFDKAERFPTPLEAAGRDEVLVGRLRADPFEPRTLHFWVVADNLRKGAATNAVQIGERLLRG